MVSSVMVSPAVIRLVFFLLIWKKEYKLPIYRSVILTMQCTIL